MSKKSTPVAQSNAATTTTEASSALAAMTGALTGTASPTAEAPKAEKKAKEPKAPTKADAAREAMKQCYADGKSYEDMVTAVMAATGHPRQLSRAYLKNNVAKCNIPASFVPEGRVSNKATPAAAPAAGNQTPASTDAPAAIEAPKADASNEPAPM